MNKSKACDSCAHITLEMMMYRNASGQPLGRLRARAIIACNMFLYHLLFLLLLLLLLFLRTCAALLSNVDKMSKESLRGRRPV